MAIAVDATSAASGSAGTTVTWAHTCAAGSILLVIAGGVDTAEITGATYNGSAMTQVVVVDSGREVDGFIHLTPSSGSNNIVVTKASGVEIDCGAISFTGAGASDATNTGTGAGTSQSLTVTTNGTGNGYVVTCMNINDPGAITYGGSGTEWSNTTAGGGGASFVYKAYTSGGNISESWTSTNSRGWAAVGVEIKEALSFRPIVASF